MTSFLEKYDIINKIQFGFQQKKRILEELVIFLECVRRGRESDANKTTSVFVDLKKAIETVKHCILLETLERAAMRGLMQDLSIFV